MKNEPADERWRELNWRRELTPAEQAELRAWLAAHPEDQADWEAEVGLTHALRRLPDVPLATNFTSRVLQAVQREAAQPARQPWLFPWVWRRPPGWLPRLAFATILVGAGLFSYHQVQAYQRTQILKRVVAVMPSPQVLTNFDNIRAFERNLERMPPPDVELLQLLK